MRVVDEGHTYLLDNLGSEGHQVLKFCKRDSSTVKHETHQEGTNTQEVLRALIDRTDYLNSLIPCEETQDASWHLRRALEAYEARALRRKLQGKNKQGEHEPGPERYKDMPFTPDSVVCLPVGSDGHVLT